MGERICRTTSENDYVERICRTTSENDYVER